MGNRRMRTALAGGLVAAALLGAGCSSSDEATDAGGMTGAPEMAAEEGFAGSSGDMDDMAESPASDGQGASVDEAIARAAGTADAAAGRALARTARLELRVADVEQAAARIRAMATRLGGFVADAEVRGGEFPYGVLTLRVPATNLDAAVGELGELATEVVLQQIGTEDLTDQLTDTATRIQNLTALEAELRALMAEIRERTSSAQELLIIFNQVNDVRFQIEQLEARRAAIEDRVALATVTVDLQPTSGEPEPAEEPSTVSEAWQATRDAFGQMGDALIWFGITIVPVGLAVLVPAALVLAGLWRLVPRRRGDAVVAESAAPAASAPNAEADTAEE